MHHHQQHPIHLLPPLPPADAALNRFEHQHQQEQQNMFCSQEEDEPHRNNNNNNCCQKTVGHHRETTRRRMRTNFNDAQTALLENTFSDTHYPDQHAKRDIALALDIPVDRVTVWFQNRRSKWRRCSANNNNNNGTRTRPNHYYTNHHYCCPSTPFVDTHQMPPMTNGGSATGFQQSTEMIRCRHVGVDFKASGAHQPKQPDDLLQQQHQSFCSAAFVNDDGMAQAFPWS